MKSKKHICPVCAYPHLTEPARSKSGGGSYEICPSCGFQFGVDDDDKAITFEQWRAKWIKGGAKWASKGITKPDAWDGTKQSARLASPSAAKKSPRAR